MNNKSTRILISSLLIILIFLIAPKDVAWGGSNNQTVPTIGPSRTPTVTNSPTNIVPTNTQPVTNPISTNTGQTILQPTIATTDESAVTEPAPTATVQKQTEEPDIEGTSVEINEQSATVSVSLPLVSANEEGDQSQEIAPEKTSPTEVVTTLPSFVLPLILVLMLVILYLIFRISGKKSSEKK